MRPGVVLPRVRGLAGPARQEFHVRRSSICLFGLLATSVTWAGPAPLDTISLPDAIRIAREHSPGSLSAEQEVVAARGALVQSHALPNPTLFVYRIGENLSPADSPVPNQFGVSWTIPIGGKRAA